MSPCVQKVRYTCLISTMQILVFSTSGISGASACTYTCACRGVGRTFKVVRLNRRTQSLCAIFQYTINIIKLPKKNPNQLDWFIRL